jgi:hypothetical protein
MALTTAFRDYVAGLVTGTGTAFDNSNAYIGVGNDNTAFAAGQTDLLGTNLRKAMDATYPQVATNVLTFRSTFATGDANFAWEEWGVFNASTGGTMMNRYVESLGTKTAAQSWQFTVDITFSV